MKTEYTEQTRHNKKNT